MNTKHQTKQRTQDQPAPGCMRLTWPQVNKIQEKYRFLWVMTTQHACQGQLILVVKRGALRFVDIRFKGSLELTAGGQELPAAEIRKLDAQVSSLCGYTEQTRGEARLILSLDRGQLTDTEVVLSEELCSVR